MTSLATCRALLVTCLAAVYFLVFPYNQGLNNPNENSRIYTTIALVEHHRFAIDDEVARFGPINDAALIDGRRVAAKAPAVSLLGVPVYWLFAHVARHFVSPADGGAWLRATTLVLRLVVVQLPAFLFLLWLLRWLERRRLDPALCLMATAALGLGTNYLAYSLMFVSHALSAAAAFVAFACILAATRPFLVGTLLGLVTLFDYQGAVVSLVLGLFALVSYRDGRARLRFVAAAALQVALLLAFQKLAFGGFLRAPFHYLEDEKLRAHHARGLLGFGAPSATALWSLLFDRTVGLFGTSPFLWLVVLALPLARTRAVGWPLALVVVLTLAVAGITNWRAGWSIGPRYLVTAMPFAVFAVAVALDRLASRGERARAIVRGSAGGLVVASVATVGLIALVFNTLPYDITRPLRQVAIPYLRAGFVPHHAGELAGWTSPAFFYVVVVALFAGAIAAAVADARGHALRWPVAVLAGVVGLLPALSMPRGECPRGVRRLTEIWEPAGRDRIGALRTRAMADPCRWRDVAALERAVCWEGADDDELRSLGCSR